MRAAGPHSCLVEAWEGGVHPGPVPSSGDQRHAPCHPVALGQGGVFIPAPPGELSRERGRPWEQRPAVGAAGFEADRPPR